MKSKTFATQALLIFSLLVCIFSAVFLLHFIFGQRAQSHLMPVTAHAVLSQDKGREDFSLPVRLQIPDIGINANVEYMSLTKDGAVDAPRGPDNVGWFQLSVRPGKVGSAVIDGHSGYKDDRPAVFDNLHKLKRGDRIYIEDKKGDIIVFVVRTLKSYGKNEKVSDVFTSNDGKVHLNLITCAGDWNPTTKTHSSRIVVFADKEI